MGAVRTVRVGALSNSFTGIDESRTEIDSHADTCVIGKHALIVHDFERPVNVVG